MASNNVVEVRFGTPGNVLEVRVGTVEVDVPRSLGYFGGLAAAAGFALIEPPLALFIAAVPAFKASLIPPCLGRSASSAKFLKEPPSR